MIETPYNNAFKIPDVLDFDLLVKKVTVIGIIGNTQGVSNAIKPPPKPFKNMTHQESLADEFTLTDFSFKLVFL